MLSTQTSMAPPLFLFFSMWVSLLFLFLSSFLLECYSSSIRQPLCHDQDSSSLLQFKDTLLFDKLACDPSSYAWVTSWKTEGNTSNCCSWNGVKCDENTGHVVGLDLASSCLYGSINSSSTLFRLVHLTSLNLAYNNFNFSTIPSGIKNLSSLTHLNLSYSSFSDQIPSQILELSNLVSLDLSRNALILRKPSLKDLVETLINLTELDLRYVMISSTVPQSLANLSSLSSILLSGCGLYGEFPAGVFQLSNLHTLSLRSNPDLTGHLPEFQEGSPLEMLRLENTSFSGQIPDSIDNLKSLNNFVASSCRFSGPIPSSIGLLVKLNVLDLSNNNFSGQIPSSLGNLLQLTYLSLSSNNFDPRTMYWIENMTNLHLLDLTKTNLVGDIPSSLRNLTQLTHLLLNSNKLTGQVPSWLGDLTQLTVIQLADNKLQGPIPNSIFGLPDLEKLELHYNQLNGSLSFDLFIKSTKLVDLQLSRNRLSLSSGPNVVDTTAPKFKYLGLSSCNLSEFPYFLRGQNNLEILDLSRNKIEGLVPSWITDLATESLRILNLDSNLMTGFEQPFADLPWTNLYVLNLTSNSFQGSLPIPPPSIFIYSVSDNRFTGEISPVFCNLTSALTLDISNNNLSGSVPECLGSLSNFVSVLDLHNNSFSGNIPDRFTSDCALRMLDFSQNKLEGKIPSSLTKCTKLESLHLGNNQIIDYFPYWLGILPELRVLILRSNGFLGAIGKPEINFQFPHLQIIDLSDNNFTGRLPLEYFKSWVAMKRTDRERLKYMEANTSFQIADYSWSSQFSYSITISNKGREMLYERVLEFFAAIDFSSNKFEGGIPEEIGSLKGLQLLNLSNNILTGEIPISLENLTDLEALDLSMNNLSGEIPPQLSQLTFLAFLNLSHNDLTGPVPRGNQFETFQNASFSGNPRLCGYPLSKECGDGGGSPIPGPDAEESESSFELKWKTALIGYGSGLLTGIAIGCRVNIRKHEWLIEKFSR